MKHEFETPLQLVNHEHNTNLLAWGEETTERVVNEETGEKRTYYLYHTARVPAGADYPTIVTAIIRTRYTADDVEAIVLNAGDTPKHKAELEALQQWRTEAKRVAKQVLAQK